jgi:hypothetical protein
MNNTPQGILVYIYNMNKHIECNHILLLLLIYISLIIIIYKLINLYIFYKLIC